MSKHLKAVIKTIRMLATRFGQGIIVFLQPCTFIRGVALYDFL